MERGELAVAGTLARKQLVPWQRLRPAAGAERTGQYSTCICSGADAVERQELGRRQWAADAPASRVPRACSQIRCTTLLVCRSRPSCRWPSRRSK